MKHTERGFSLIEMLIVVIILSFCLLAVVALGIRMKSAGLSYGQNAEAADRETILTSQIKRDFENVGFNLNAPLTQNASGQVAPLFLENSGYQVQTSGNVATVRRTSASGNDYLQSGWLLSYGSASMSFVPNAVNSYFGFADRAGQSHSFYIRDGRSWTVYENSQAVMSSEQSGESISAGDKLTVALDSSSQNSCIIGYYLQRGEERRLLYNQRIECSSYPFQASLFLETGSSVDYFTLNGSWFESAFPNDADAPVPLPLRQGAASTVPIWIDRGGESFTALASDTEMDVSKLVTPASFRDAAYYQIVLQISTRQRGIINDGDYFLLIDGENQKSVLGKVTPADDGSVSRDSEYVIFRPATANAPAWTDFWSATSDYAGHSFPVGSRLVRLTPPVSYRIYTDRSDDTNQPGRIVLRREGDAPWEKVAFGISDFNLVEQSDAGGRHAFNLNFSSLPEDTESVEPHRVSLTISPAALNLR